jgi:phage antirepressor YoqD-like protein
VHLQLFSQVNVGDAAKQLGIGKTKFKAICRSFGISRWPYR